ncbi:uncharacterized protein N7511_009161 [Penicillium nucicola]|uniref:uncharacterized protein n=1 Tax=Penicillium nucicola TaxID=1850975 RepID=UPI002545146C|nr:uncharacterized protein N7511_009161 [Penicillium nucicola]KAJ5747465.1 hypothetical protein N7511_009161 [Penicillium nucicola]
MSFGFGVGDFLAVIKLASKVRKNLIDAPVQFQAISDEVRNLSILLQDVDIDLSRTDLTSTQQTKLQGIVKSSHDVLIDLETIISRYKHLDTIDGTKRSAAKRVWGRLTWEPSEIQELRSRISSNIGLLNLFNIRATQKDLANLVQHQDDQTRQTILAWLSPLNYATQQSDYIARRQLGTGQWLLASPEFSSWISGSKRILFCPGIPGAGKTILASTVIEELLERYGTDSNIAIAYIYCNFQRREQQTAVNLLINILKQVAQGRDDLPTEIRTMYTRHRFKGTRASVDEVLTALRSVCKPSLTSRFYLVIDALDECSISDGSRTTFLDGILSLRDCNLNLLVTSRFIPEISETFKNDPTLEIRATKEDVIWFLKSNLASLPFFVRRDPGLQDEILTGIAKNIDGISLVGKRSPKAIRASLKGISSGAQTYDTSYDAAMQRIKAQLPDQTELALQVLLWVTCSKRQLTTAELRIALAVEIEESEFDRDNMPDIMDVVSVCAGLVTVDENSDIIRLAHYTTQEYFERHQSTWFPTAHLDIGTICLKYLSIFDAEDILACSSVHDLERTVDKDSFCGYAGTYWGHHIRESSPANTGDVNERLIFALLENQSRLDACVRILVAKEIDFFSDLLHGDIVHHVQIPPLCLAAWFGLTLIAQGLIEQGCPVDTVDCFQQTPLFYAVSQGFSDLTLLLLDRGDDPKGTTGENQVSLLSSAAIYNQVHIAELLLSRGSEINSHHCITGETPLHFALSRGLDTTVRFLVEKGADIESKTCYDRTPLIEATRFGRKAVVQLFLDMHVDPNSKDNTGLTALSIAFQAGNTEIAQLLRDHGADPHTPDNAGQTPLIYASQRGLENSINMLLSWASNLEHRDHRGRTPLLTAVSAGHESVVRALSQNGANFNSVDTFGRGVLFMAACEGHDTMLALFLSRVDPNQRDRYGRTALHAAATLGHPRACRVLLNVPGLDCNVEDNFGRSAMFDAMLQDRHDVVEVLQEFSVTSADPAFVKTSIRQPEAVFVRSCDVCLVLLTRAEAFYSCHSCHGGDFHICFVCYQVGARCLNDTHRVFERRRKSNIGHVLITPRILPF